MAKYSYEFKKNIVQGYLNGNVGTPYLAKKYNIAHNSTVQLWIKNYSAYGDEGLKRSRHKHKYSFEYKLHMVELYLSSEVSYRELALQEELNNPAMLIKWVNEFRTAGPDALRPKKKGRKKLLESKKKKYADETNIEALPIDTSVEHIKQLEDELLKLRIENAYLKELRRLRLEEEALLKKQRESSTASEEISN